MDIRIRATGEIINDREFKRRHPNTSFAGGIVPEMFIAEQGADVVLEGPKPTGQWWQYPERDGVEQIKGDWYWKYRLGPVFATQAEEDEYREAREAELHRQKEIMVNDERERRILAGNTFMGIYLTGDVTNKSNLSDLAFAASLRLSVGDVNHITVFRDGNNIDHNLTPMQIIGLWQAAATYVSNIYQKSWELKAMNPIPEDFTDDSYWS